LKNKESSSNKKAQARMLRQAQEANLTGDQSIEIDTNLTGDQSIDT
jgi:hypothetical protein